MCRISLQQLTHLLEKRVRGQHKLRQHCHDICCTADRDVASEGPQCLYQTRYHLGSVHGFHGIRDVLSGHRCGNSTTRATAADYEANETPQHNGACVQQFADDGAKGLELLALKLAVVRGGLSGQRPQTTVLQMLRIQIRIEIKSKSVLNANREVPASDIQSP